MNDADRPTREVVEVDEPTRERDYRAVSIVGDFSRELAEEFGRLWTAESVAALRPLIAYKRPGRARRWLDALRDLPYVLTDKIGDDEETAFTRRLMLAVLLTFALACLLWLAAWVLR